MPETILDHSHVAAAAARLRGKIHRTPLAESALLNRWLGHRIVFKCENMQRIGAFKARGAMHSLLLLREQGRLPRHVVSHSSGNHAQAVAWACREMGVPCRIYTPKGVSALKRQATESYGAEVVVLDKRAQTHERCRADEAAGSYLLPPFDSDAVIAGQGTACLEALEDGAQPDAVFAPCGGGGLLSGTLLAARGKAPKASVFGVEPVDANDAARTYRDKKLFSFDDSPKSIADGVCTMSLSERTAYYVMQTNGIVEVTEDEIIYWTQWLTHLLKVTVEPTGALGLAGAVHWLRAQPGGRTVLVILSGGNLSLDTRAQAWGRDYLGLLPSLYSPDQLKT